jgi:hypothetical protein
MDPGTFDPANTREVRLKRISPGRCRARCSSQPTRTGTNCQPTQYAHQLLDASHQEWSSTKLRLADRCTEVHTVLYDFPYIEARGGAVGLPTWNGKPVDQSSQEMVEATTQAWDVLREALSGHLTDRPAQELLHAVEAAAWLERLSDVGRHLLVPITKVNGASWAELGAAMGVSRATAQHRHQEQVKEWEDSVRRAAMPPPWKGVEPLAAVDPPAEFYPGDDDFVREPRRPAWEYTGPLEPAIQYVRAHHTDVLVYNCDGTHYVSSQNGNSHMSTSADSEEEAWRSHLGHALTTGKPWPDDARPGETLARFKARTGAE